MEKIRRNRHEMDLTVGPIFKKLIIYSLPLIGVNLLQLLFNAADVMVLGIFANDGDNAVAAVGATTSIVNLLIGFFVGLSMWAMLRLWVKCGIIIQIFPHWKILERSKCDGKKELF